MNRRPPITTAAARIAIALASVWFLFGTALPWLARSGYAGPVMRENIRHDRDATALFYAEHERTWQLLRETREEDRHAVAP
jgi:hypothetical protein